MYNSGWKNPLKYISRKRKGLWHFVIDIHKKIYIFKYIATGHSDPEYRSPIWCKVCMSECAYKTCVYVYIIGRGYWLRQRPAIFLRIDLFCVIHRQETLLLQKTKETWNHINCCTQWLNETTHFIWTKACIERPRGRDCQNITFQNTLRRQNLYCLWTTPF